jgi:hypothetical protein
MTSFLSISNVLLIVSSQQSPRSLPPRSRGLLRTLGTPVFSIPTSASPSRGTPPQAPRAASLDVEVHTGAPRESPKEVSGGLTFEDGSGDEDTEDNAVAGEA